MSIVPVLQKYSSLYHPVVPFDINNSKVWVPDLTIKNSILHEIDLTDTQVFSDYIFGEMQKRNTPVAIGGYNEDRFLYHRSNHFGGAERRSIHLGIDIWAAADTPVFAPLAGKVHSFANNATFGDYGYTIILEHNIDNTTFFTLYGHLSSQNFNLLFYGKSFEAGEILGWLGHPHENGNWTPHLHFQIISDIGYRKGDFPGVAALSQRAYYLNLCPDPNLILNCKNLTTTL
jgi:murein DD-endopeptidase MepM/ murein hydrolase activator NlpD